jgi:hypothetical protein
MMMRSDKLKRSVVLMTEVMYQCEQKNRAYKYARHPIRCIVLIVYSSVGDKSHKIMKIGVL